MKRHSSKRPTISQVAERAGVSAGTVSNYLNGTVSVSPDRSIRIQEAIEPIIQSRTSILIAHRLSTILAADEILVVKDGRIVERGTHAELVHAGGTYTELYETQFKKALEKTEG